MFRIDGNHWRIGKIQQRISFAKSAAEARWGHAPGMRDACAAHAEGNADGPVPYNKTCIGQEGARGHGTHEANKQDWTGAFGSG